MIKINGNIVGGNLVGRNVSVINGRVIVDGKDLTPEEKVINIEVTGNIDLLSADACTQISVKGDVKTVKTMSGDVDISGNVNGSVSTMSGDVTAQKIEGNASSMSGDIRGI